MGQINKTHVSMALECMDNITPFITMHSGNTIIKKKGTL
jgi:hypothetical protein